MSLFRKIGQNVERFKQAADEAAKETYVCRDCDAELHAEYTKCPECGGHDIERVDE